MSTRSSTRNLFPPLDNLELTIQRRPRVDPTLLNDFETATNGNGDDVPPPGGGDLPAPDLRTMEDLCQPTLNGRGGPIALIAIQATNFGLKNDMIQQVTQSIKVNGVTNDALRLYLFLHSLTHHATAWFDCLPRNSITTFEQMAKMFLGKYFPPSMVTKIRNEITNFRQRLDELSESSSSITSSFDPEIVALKAEMVEINKNLMKVLQINQQVKAVTHNCETCGGPHSYNDCPATVGQTQNVYVVGAYNQGGNSYQPQALADLGASINLMPLSVWNKLSLPELSPTCMTLELTDSSISHLVGVAEDVFVKTGRALIDVYEGELTLRVGNKAITLNLDQTSRYFANYDAMSVNRIDLIDVAYEGYSQEVLGFSGDDKLPVIIAKDLEDEEKINLIKVLKSHKQALNSKRTLVDPSLLNNFEEINMSANGNGDDGPPTEGGDLPVLDLQTMEELCQPTLNGQGGPISLITIQATNFGLKNDMIQQGDDKLPVIIAKDLEDEEKINLIKVLKSHKQALTWQLFDIKGINLEFFSHKILIEDDFKPAVQYQRRVNPKIHEVIKKEVLKILDAELIYPISDSPWVTPVHYVHKKGGFTVVENEENELIPTRLVTGWRYALTTKS
nr:reverse transcriptase domain-containing protein [Tanacetum cinerariifolium]